MGVLVPSTGRRHSYAVLQIVASVGPYRLKKLHDASHRLASSGGQLSPATMTVVKGYDDSGKVARTDGVSTTVVTSCRIIRSASGCPPMSASLEAMHSDAPQPSANTISNIEASKFGEANCKTLSFGDKPNIRRSA